MASLSFVKLVFHLAGNKLYLTLILLVFISGKMTQEGYFPMLTLKIELSVIFPAKWVYSGAAENCNSGQTSMAKPQACSDKERRLLYRMNRVSWGTVLSKESIEDTRSPMCRGCSLAELLRSCCWEKQKLFPLLTG